MLEVEDLTVAYGDVEVLHDVSLRVSEGEIVALVGANAAGKSTLLAALSGLVPKRRGKVSFLGSSIENAASHEIVALGIVQIPEGRRLFPQMTVRENLEIGASAKSARERRQTTLEEVFDLFPALGERQQQLAGSLSGGEAQMCAIGRGLMALPRLLMLDEPSLGLAPMMVQACFQVVTQLNREQGTTILLVEQNVRHSLRISHRAYVLENGSIAIEGDAADLLDDDRVRRAYLGL